jgi:flagellar motor switch/type III secretory pathway protein FliN
VDFRGADAGLHELLARHIFASPVSINGTAVTEAVSLCNSAPFSADLITTPMIGLEVRLAEQETWHSSFLGAEATVLNALFQALPDNPPHAKPLPATIPASVRSQDLLLPADDLANLARGDLIYLENTSPDALNRWLYLCGERQDTLTPIDNLFRVNGFTGSRDATMRTNQMDQAKTQSGADVRVPLSIEFGTKRMTAEEVCKLTDGSIIDFGPVSLDSVGLRIGEKIVARGMLVEIGDGVGLQITTVY